MIFRLRSYKPGDFESLHEIDQACYEPPIAYSRRELRNYLRFPGADCSVAQAGGKIAGFLLTASSGQWGYIVTIDVLESYRRRRLGTKLLARAERRLAARGVRQVALETATDNAPAIAFWQKHGYRTRGVRKDYYYSGRDAYSMIKALNPRAGKTPKGSEAN